MAQCRPLPFYKQKLFCYMCLENFDNFDCLICDKFGPILSKKKMLLIVVMECHSLYAKKCDLVGDIKSDHR